MKILHVWSCAGVSSLIARYMDERYGTESDVIITEKWDKDGLNDYRTRRYRSKRGFGLRALVMAREYDLIHVHYHGIMILWLKMFYQKKPMILHYHGTDVREKWEEVSETVKWADYVLVSTKDLLKGAPERVSWSPNPVDTVLFKTEPRVFGFGTRAFTLSYDADDVALAIAREHGLDLTIIRGWITHDELPELMSGFDYYIDVKRDSLGRLLPIVGLPVLSKTGLEALSRGLRVIAKDGEVRVGLPDMHRPETVADNLFSLYEELTR